MHFFRFWVLLGPPQILWGPLGPSGTLWDPGTWGPREFGKDPSRPKIGKIAFCFLQFFRDICQKPPENARVGAQ